MKRILHIAGVLIAVLSGCTTRQPGSFVPVPLVTAALGDVQSDAYQIVSSYENALVKGDIAIIDDPQRCLLLSEAFLTADYFDNVDGATLKDGLPDFAGEVVSSLMDTRYAPYSQYLGGQEESLRDLSVRAFLSAIDTTCKHASYDLVAMSYKPKAKAVVLSAPAMAAYGLHDIDSLVSGAGLTVPVISPVVSMIREATGQHDGQLNAAVLASPDVIRSGAYQQIFPTMAGADSRLVTISMNAEPEESQDLQEDVMPGHETAVRDILRSALDSCRARGMQKVNALLIDDYSVSVDGLESLLRSLRESQEEDDIRYIQMLSRDFRIIDPRRSVVEDCFHRFRQLNIFTHNIAYPSASAYITCPEAAHYTLMDFDESSLPDGLHEFMLDKAPKTHDSYVQNQHFSRGN